MKTCTAFFLLILLFFPVPRCEAVTAQAVYDPDERSESRGFFDDTRLTQAERNSLGPGGSDVTTLGEARRRAFERVLCVFENRLRGEFTIRVSAGFMSFAGDSETLITLAAAAPCHVATVSRTGETGVGYPSALARAVFGEERIRGLCDAYDIKMAFSDRANIFHYGTGAAPRGTVDFAGVAMHEIFHGLGFFDYVRPDGSPLSDTVDGRTVTLSSVYDLGTYSRADDDFLVNLTDAQRRAAITSGDGLLWGGAAGRRAAASKSSGVAADGKPRLYAPSDYESSSSVSHLDLSVHPDDLLEPFHNNSADTTLALALLEDMGWEINAGPLPRSCAPGATSSSPPPSGTTRPPSPASQPVLPPIPVPPPLPEPAEAPSPEPMTEQPSPNGSPSTSGNTDGGGSGGCAIARGGGTTERNIAFAGLLPIVLVLAPAIFRKETREETCRRPDG